MAECLVESRTSISRGLKQMFGSGRMIIGFTLALAGIGVVAAPGCANNHRTKAPRVERPSYLIFNPGRSNLPTTILARSDWPATPNTLSVREEFEYQERFIDYQGRAHGLGSDYVYRRFDSVRTGRSRR